MLTRRLQKCAELVSSGGVACDVGTDHAYLAAELLRMGKCHHVIASDIAEGPLQAARRTLEQAGFLQQAELVLSDGLRQVDGSQVTDIIIAGMGGETIVHILEDCPWQLHGKRLILQPMTKAAVLRRWLAEHGYHVEQEQVVQEEKFFYTIMQVQYDGIQRQLSPIVEEVGELSGEAEVVRAYLQRRQKQFASIAKQTETADPAVSSYYAALCATMQEF